MKVNTSLTTIYLYNNRIGVEGGKIIAEALRETPLTKFFFAANIIGDESKGNVEALKAIPR